MWGTHRINFDLHVFFKSHSLNGKQCQQLMFSYNLHIILHTKVI